MKLLLLADLHMGQTRPSSTHPGINRQSSSEVLSELSKLIPYFNKQKYDLILQMGDVIRETGDKSVDEPLYEEVFSLLSKLNTPLINLLGNHELNTYNRNELMDMYQNFGMNSNFYGSTKINGYKVIWLDHQINSEGIQCLSNERLNWLKQELDVNSEIILVSHYSTISQNVKGNFYFESKPTQVFYDNSKEIMNTINNTNVVIAICAHSHWISYKKLNKTSFISVPSFSENIAAQKYTDNNPAIYTTLETVDGNMIIKSFSGDFCFFNLEVANGL